MHPNYGVVFGCWLLVCRLKLRLHPVKKTFPACQPTPRLRIPGGDQADAQPVGPQKNMIKDDAQI